MAKEACEYRGAKNFVKGDKIGALVCYIFFGWATCEEELGIAPPVPLLF